jgi:hypothetical protein
MSSEFRDYLRVALVSSLVLGGLTTVSLVATTALTNGAASASTPVLFSSTTPGRYLVAVPPGVTAISITAVGGSGGTRYDSGGRAAIVTKTATVAAGDLLTVTVGANGVGGGVGGSGAGSGGIGGVASTDGGGGGGGSMVVDGGAQLVVAGGGGGGSIYGSGGNADQTGVGYNNGQGWAGTLAGPGASGINNACAQLKIGSPGSGMNGGNGMSGGGGGGYAGGGAGCYGGGGGGASYPTAAGGWDTSSSPAVSIAIPSFFVATESLPVATAGIAYGPVTLQAANLGVSSIPFSTTLKWKKVRLPKGLTLSTSGVLTGIPISTAIPPSSVTVEVTETVTTVNGKVTVKSKTTVKATIPL